MKKGLIAGLIAGSLFLSSNIKAQNLEKLVTPTPVQTITAEKTPIHTIFAEKTTDIESQSPTATETATPITTPGIKLKQPYVPIFYFHRIRDTERSVSEFLNPSKAQKINITKNELYANLDWLYKDNFRLVPLEDILNNKINLPKGLKPMGITVDDNYENNNFVSVYRQILARHKDFGKGLVFFVSSEHKNFGVSKFIFDELIETYQKLGISVQAHGTKHISLRNATLEQAKAEVEPLLKIFEDCKLPRPKYWCLAYGNHPHNKQVVGYLMQFDAVLTCDGDLLDLNDMDKTKIPRMDGANFKESRMMLKARERKTMGYVAPTPTATVKKRK